MIRTPIISAERSSASSEHDNFELPLPKLNPMALSTITTPTPTRTPSPIHIDGFPFPFTDSAVPSEPRPSLGVSPLSSFRSISPPSYSSSLPPLSSILTPPLSTAATSPQLPPSPQFSTRTPTAKYYDYEEEEEDEATNDTITQFTQPLTLAERRQRNKAASAKYRAKKQIQTHEMKSMIQDLTEQNGLLSRQLEDSRNENAHLKRVCDQLRAQIVADKMIKRYLKSEASGREDLDEMMRLENKRPKREYDNFYER